MPQVTGLLLPSHDLPPVPISVRFSRNNMPQVLQSVLNTTKAPVVNNCQLGVIYSCGDTETQDKNKLATQLRSKYSRKMPDHMTLTQGPCFLVGEDEKGVTTSVSKEATQTVMDLCKELTGYSMPVGTGGKKGTKVKRDGPKKAKTDFNYFNSDFQKSRREELKMKGMPAVFKDINREASDAWKLMTPKDKEKYVALAAADRIRYDQEKAELLKKNPPPPKHPRTAFHIFCQEFKDKNNRPDWKTSSKEFKEPFEQKAAEDKLRYEKELEVFRNDCIAAGKPELFNTATAKKTKKRKTEDSGAEEDSGESKPKRKKAKTADDEDEDSGAEKKKKKRTKSSDGTAGTKKKKSSKDSKSSKKKKSDDEDHQDAAEEEAESMDE